MYIVVLPMTIEDNGAVLFVVCNYLFALSSDIPLLLHIVSASIANGNISLVIPVTD